ncbi:unnamed protein product [Cuscuta campestris]|uniref:UBX domain-containing protein n=2 Tax=Cuscuta sect. Cleistogrammica TaxID=1824901 RepID=A0A484MMI6_9ASTE|nr:hypothetical protein DM860_005194 [Cuscuta australis]VFQ90052.1 unnamed protein product [Cuscuta campestris]
MIVDSTAALKRRRFSTVDPMEADSAKAKLAAAKEKLGHEFRVFQTITESVVSSDIPNSDESEDFYEFTADDYYRLLATKKEDKYLKTRKIREAEQAARRSRITKTAIRVRFPDNFTLEASFHPSETIQDLVNLLTKVVARPDLPFYLYTTPPKKQIKDTSQDFYSAGFVPGAIVYFSYNAAKGDDGAHGQHYLQEEILSLQGLESAITKQPDEVVPELPPSVADNHTPQEQKPAEKKNIKPKWLKM